VQTKDNSSPNKRRWATSTNPQALIMNNRLPTTGGPPQSFLDNEIEDE